VSGYRWDPVVRVVPFNGSETIYWLSDRLTDMGSHTKLRLTYLTDMTTHEDINRNLYPVINAIRPQVEIECLIVSMADQLFLSEIEYALTHPKECDVFLSLDGGCVERKVILGTLSQAEPINGKTCVGATFRLTMKCFAPIDSKPAMMTDPGVGSEKLQGGSFDDWSSSSVAQGWEANGNLTLAQEGTIKKSGDWSAKATVSGVGYASLTNLAAFSLNPGAWHRLRVSCRGGQTSNNGLSAQIWNTSFPGSTSSVPRALLMARPIVGAFGLVWANAGAVYENISAAAFTSFDCYFRGPKVGPAFKASDIYQFRLHGIVSVGEIAYYDDVSIYGPVLLPGYSTW